MLRTCVMIIRAGCPDGSNQRQRSCAHHGAPCLSRNTTEHLHTASHLTLQHVLVDRCERCRCTAGYRLPCTLSIYHTMRLNKEAASRPRLGACAYACAAPQLTCHHGGTLALRWCVHVAACAEAASGEIIELYLHIAFHVAAISLHTTTAPSAPAMHANLPHRSICASLRPGVCFLTLHQGT